MTIDFKERVPFGISNIHVNYIITTLSLEGICDFVDGILWVPFEHENSVYELVKNYRELKASAEAYREQAMGTS